VRSSSQPHNPLTAIDEVCQGLRSVVPGLLLLLSEQEVAQKDVLASLRRVEAKNARHQAALFRKISRGALGPRGNSRHLVRLGRKLVVCDRCLTACYKGRRASPPDIQRSKQLQVYRGALRNKPVSKAYALNYKHFSMQAV
jgi:hypothetical protein